MKESFYVIAQDFSRHIWKITNLLEQINEFPWYLHLPKLTPDLNEVNFPNPSIGPTVNLFLS